MGQPSETIRPRQRRRTDPAGSSATASRAEQSTRVLIRVPLVSIGKTPAPPSNKTPGKAPGSTPAERPAAPPSAGRESAALQQESTLVSRPPNTRSELRIDVAHADASGPHSAAPAWLEVRGGWLAGILQRKSLLTIGLLVTVGVLAALLSSHRNNRHLSPDGRTAGTTDASNQLPAKSIMPGSVKDESAQGGRQLRPGKNFDAGSTHTSSNTSGGREAQMNGALAAPGDWKLPVATNMPASLEPTNRTPPATDSNAPGASPPSMYQPYLSARREPLPGAGPGNLDSQTAPSGAAFEGVLDRPPILESR